MILAIPSSSHILSPRAVKALTAENAKATLIEWVKAKRAKVLGMLPMPRGDAAEEVARVAEAFAMIAAAGELAIKTGTLNWKAGMPTEVVRRVYAHWLGKRGGSNAPSTEVGFDGNLMMRQFRSKVTSGWLSHSILRDGASENQKAPNEFWGYADMTGLAGIGYMTRDAFTNIVDWCDPDQSAKLLHKAGLLEYTTTHNARVKAIGPGKDGRGAQARFWHVYLPALFSDRNRMATKNRLIEHTQIVIGWLEGLVAAGRADEGLIAQLNKLTETLKGLERKDEKMNY